MSSKDKPLRCKSDCVCKATAKLKEQVEKELEVRDKTLAELFNEEETDENKNTEE